MKPNKTMDTKTNAEHQVEKTLTIDQAVEAFRVWMDDEYDVPSGSMTESEEEGLRFRLNAFASPPTLNIGMGESEVQAFVLDDLTDDSHVGLGPTHESALTIARAFMQRGMNAANAHTKAVTVEAIVNLAEEWDAYCVVTPADPDGIEDFRTRLLKLIQE